MGVSGSARRAPMSAGSVSPIERPPVVPKNRFGRSTGNSASSMITKTPVSEKSRPVSRSSRSRLVVITSCAVSCDDAAGGTAGRAKHRWSTRARIAPTSASLKPRW